VALKRLVLALVLVVSALVLGFGWWYHSSRPSVETVRRIEPTLKPPTEIKGYFLKPDRRFLQAIGEMRRVVAGPQGADSAEAAPQSAEARLEQGGWLIVCAGRSVGRLPLLPRFRDAMLLLEKDAAALRPRFPSSGAREEEDLAQAELKRFRPWAAAAAVEKAWGSSETSNRLLALGAQTLAQLCVQHVDTVGAGDALVGSALAWLALAKAATGEELAREECLLADVCGYYVEARDLASALPADDAVRFYVRHDDALLERAANAPLSTAEARFLRLKRLAEESNTMSWPAWNKLCLERDPDNRLPIMAAALASDDSETDPRKVVDATAQALDDLGYFPGLGLLGKVRRLRLDAVIDGFEEALENLKSEGGQRFPTPEAWVAWYRSFFYSALPRPSRMYLGNRWGEPYTGRLGKDGVGAAVEYRRWFKHLSAPEHGSGPADDLIQDMQNARYFGAALYLDSFAGLDERLPYADKRTLSAMFALTRLADTRPKHLSRLAWAYRNRLFALRLGEEIYRHADAIIGTHDMWLHTYVRDFVGDTQGLLQDLKMDGLRPLDRIQILESLRERPDVAVDLEGEYRKAIGQAPDSWDVTESYLDFLEEDGRRQNAIDELRRWLGQASADEDPHYSLATTRLAELLQSAGQHAEALDLLDSEDLETWELAAARREALLLDQLGRHEDALEVAETAADYNPGSVGALTLLLELRWRRDEFAQAAATLKGWEYPLDSQRWRFDIGGCFADCFLTRAEAGVKAWEALVAAGLAGSERTGEMAAEVSRRGNADLAFRMERWRGAIGFDRLRQVAFAYRDIRTSKGKDAALAWLSGMVTEKQREPFCVMIFTAKEHELLWDFPPATLTGDAGEYWWLTRAGASLLKDPGAKRRALLSEYLSKRGSSYYHTIARFLHGLETRDTLLGLADKDDKRCEIYYWIGLKEQVEGRYPEAADWYLRCLLTNQRNEGETHWAHEQLQLWAQQYEPLDQLTRQ
jgi:tetratricopeptide (TPR) repeat protein